MFPRTAGVVATCALSASAILLPPGVVPAQAGSNSLDPIVNPKQQLVEVKCSECAFGPKQETTASTESDDDLLWIQGGAHNLALNFTISADGQYLQLSGQNFYPTVAFDASQIVAHQVAAGTSMADIRAGTARSTPLHITASGMGIERDEPIGTDGDQMTHLTFQLLALEGTDVHVDEIAIDLLSVAGPDPEKLIMQTYTRPNRMGPAIPTAPDHKEADNKTPAKPHHGPCPNLPGPVCDFKHMLEDKFAAIKASHHSSRPCPGKQQQPQPPFHHAPIPNFRAHHGHGDLHHHRKPVVHHALALLATLVTSLLIPIAAGVALGMAACVLAVAIGRVAGMMWARMRGRGGEYERVTEDDKEEFNDEAGHGRGGFGYGIYVEGLEEGKMVVSREEGLVEEKEVLPAYEEAPRYEEAPGYEETPRS